MNSTDIAAQARKLADEFGPHGHSTATVLRQCAAALEAKPAEVDELMALIDECLAGKCWVLSGDNFTPMRDAIEASARKLAAPERTEQAAPEGMKPTFPLSAWDTMEHARHALSAMLTHMGMDEDEWNKPTFEKSRSAVKALEYQLTQPDQVALWKTRYLQVKAPLQAFHEKAVAAGFDGIADALDAARPLIASPTAQPSVEPVGDDLRQRCAEILEWQNTGILKGEKLREFAAKQRWADDPHVLMIAERETAREAFEVLASPPPAPVLLSDAERTDLITAAFAIATRNDETAVLHEVDAERIVELLSKLVQFDIDAVSDAVEAETARRLGGGE